MDTGSSIPAAWVGFIILAVGVALLIVWAMTVWRRLKPTLFPSSEQREETTGAQTNSKHLGRNEWVERVASVIAQAGNALAADKAPIAQDAAELVQKIETDVHGLLSAVKRTIQKTLDSAQLHSVLVRSNGMMAYVLAVPGRHEHYHLIRRYPAFSKGWVSHFELMRTSLMSNPDFSALICLIFFFSPEQRDGILLISYADRVNVLHPRELMSETELLACPAESAGAHVEFKMSA